MEQICKECGVFKEHHALSFCRSCYRKRRYSQNPEKQKSASREWYRNNSEKAKAYHKQWVRIHPEEARKISKMSSAQYSKARPEQAKRSQRKWYLENLEKARACSREYWKNNPTKRREHRQKRRASGEIEVGTIFRLVNENMLKYGATCCEKCKIECENGYHVDHIVPISKAGTHDYDNLQVLCARCNLKKHTEIADYREIAQSGQMCLACCIS